MTLREQDLNLVHTLFIFDVMKSKGSIFLILFSIIMLHMVVDVVFALHESGMVIEKMDQKTQSLASESGHSDEDVTLHDFFLLDPCPVNGQRINLRDFNFQSQFRITFWRPPKVS